MAVDSKSPAVNLVDLLRAIGGVVEGATGWAVKIGNMPPTPDKVVMVRDTGGKSPEVSVAIDYPTVQWLIRGDASADSYDKAYNKAFQLREVLASIPSRPAAYPELASVVVIGDINPLGYSDNNRPTFSLNMQLITHYETSGHRVL